MSLRIIVFVLVALSVIMLNCSPESVKKEQFTFILDNCSLNRCNLLYTAPSFDDYQGGAENPLRAFPTFFSDTFAINLSLDSAAKYFGLNSCQMEKVQPITSSLSQLYIPENQYNIVFVDLDTVNRFSFQSYFPQTDHYPDVYSFIFPREFYCDGITKVLSGYTSRQRGVFWELCTFKNGKCDFETVEYLFRAKYPTPRFY